MRASEVRAALIAAVRALAPDARAGVNDRFVHVEQPRDPDTAQERTFRISLAAQPVKDDSLNTCDMTRGEWSLGIFYPWTPAMDDRIALDAERLDAALSEDAMTAYDADFQHVVVTPTGVEETQQLVIARWSIVVRYRNHEVLS